MSTSAVSSSSLYQQIQSYFQTRRSDVQQLGQALSSGSLSDAQTAYNSITTLGQGGPFARGNAFSARNREQDFSAIGQALQSGDLAGAQQAFSELQSTFAKRAQPVVTDPVPTPAPTSTSTPTSTPTSTSAPVSSSGPEIILNLSSGGNSATPEQVTINISNPSNGGPDQVSLSIGNQQGSSPEQITFNLNPSCNEQIILNLLGASSTSGVASPVAATSTGASSGSAGSINVSA